MKTDENKGKVKMQNWFFENDYRKIYRVEFLLFGSQTCFVFIVFYMICAMSSIKENKTNDICCRQHTVNHL